MWGMALIYVGAVYAVGRSVVKQLTALAEADVTRAQKAYQQIVSRKKEIDTEEKTLSLKAAQIFTLYDMTKEITRNFSEEDAFNVFKKRLQENAQFAECLLLDPLDSKIKEYEENSTYFVFPLKGQRRLSGYLVIKGIKPQDQEKTLILCQQFALAFRRIHLYKEVEKLAITDGLTEVHTRRYILDHFEEELKRSVSRRTPLSLLMIDVDFFKHFNDQHGHLTGDQILREIATIIRDNIREIDLAGRYGGEEFCAVLPETDENGANYVAERIRSAVEKAVIRAYDKEIKATVSIGISTFPKDGKLSAELIDKADWALYRAKKMGRNGICTFGVYE